MERCETCGNEYEETFDITIGGETHAFDCFECAIHKLAPTCASCGCRILGHGVESNASTFCCAHCARRAGVEGLRTHV